MIDVLLRMAIAGAVCGWIGYARVAAGGPVSAPGVKSDRGVYPEPPLPALPKAGGTYVDPVFGTTIMRLTDAPDGKSCHHAYSYWPSFNKDGTRLFVCCDGRFVVYTSNFGNRARRDVFVLKVPPF